MATTSMPWVKLYREIIDDPKLGRLTDSAKWRFVQLIVLAGESDADGCLTNGDAPLCADDIAWRLRADAATVKAEIEQLKAVGVIQDQAGTLCVINFTKRQGAPQAERQRRWRENQKAKRTKSKDDKTDDSDDVSHGGKTVINDATLQIRPREEKRREEKIYASCDADEPLDLDSPTLSVSDSTKPTAHNAMTQTNINPAEFGMNWLEKNAHKEGERIIRSWNLAQHLENISIEFVRLTGITPKGGEKRGDKKLFALGASDWLKAGFTVADMKEAYALAQGRYTVTHLGALFREVQKLRAQRPVPVPAGIEDAMTTPNGKVVSHVR